MTTTAWYFTAGSQRRLGRPLTAASHLTVGTWKGELRLTTLTDIFGLPGR